LPYEFNLRLPPTLDLDTVISHLPPTFFTDPPPPPDKANPQNPSSTSASSPPPPINRPAFALALLGWQSLTHPTLGNQVPNSASCHTCLRRLGLWMFKSREIDPATNEILVPAPMDHLDPLREHRFFCPWKNAAAQRNPGLASRPLAKGERELPAWEVLVQGLRNEALIRERVGGGGTKKRNNTNNYSNDATAAAGHGRSKSSGVVPATAGQPKTPERARPTTVAGAPRIMVGDTEAEEGRGAGGGVQEGEGDDEEARKKKDMDMMSRLRRVKSLFNTKAGGKLKKLSSRPGTSHSNVGGE
jgi:hypothetical protein